MADAELSASDAIYLVTSNMTNDSTQTTEEMTVYLAAFDNGTLKPVEGLYIQPGGGLVDVTVYS